jgi:hypothetical protein
MSGLPELTATQLYTAEANEVHRILDNHHAPRHTADGAVLSMSQRVQELVESLRRHISAQAR